MLGLIVSAMVAVATTGTGPVVRTQATAISAALFDFDGTLAQSEDTHRKTFAEILGRDPEKDMDMAFWEQHCVGHAPPEIIRRHRKPDATHSVEEMVEARAQLFEACIERGELPLTRGTRELLVGLRENDVRCAVVTSGPRSYIEKALRKLQIFDCFEVIVTGSDAAVQGRLKPDPFPFLHAAEQLGVDPECCLAFEDVRSHSGSNKPEPTSRILTEDLTHVCSASAVGHRYQIGAERRDARRGRRRQHKQPPAGRLGWHCRSCTRLLRHGRAAAASRMRRV